MTVTIANTIFRALSKKREVNWAVIIADVVGKLIPRIGKRPYPISPFRFHFYTKYDYLTDAEQEKLSVAKYFAEV